MDTLSPIEDTIIHTFFTSKAITVTNMRFQRPAYKQHLGCIYSAFRLAYSEANRRIPQPRPA